MARPTKCPAVLRPIPHLPRRRRSLALPAGAQRASFSAKSLTTCTPATRLSTWPLLRFDVRSPGFWLRTGPIATRPIAAAPSPCTTRRTPTTGTRRRKPRRSSTSCRSARIPTPWIAAAWRPCTGRSERGRCPRSERCWTEVRTQGRQTRPARHPCTSPFRRLGEAGAVLSTHAGSRPASSGCCWNAAQARPTKTGEVDPCAKRRPVSGFELCSSERPADQSSRKTTNQTDADRGAFGAVSPLSWLIKMTRNPPAQNGCGLSWPGEARTAVGAASRRGQDKQWLSAPVGSTAGAPSTPQARCAPRNKSKSPPHPSPVPFAVAPLVETSAISGDLSTPSSSSAFSAAFCSALFLFGPQALAYRLPSITTHTSKHLL